MAWSCRCGPKPSRRFATSFTIPNKVVTKGELIDAVWRETPVTDDSLVQCVHEIRRALKDENHGVLQTVSKRGYRIALPEKSTPPTP